ncbi:hypothetical protein C2G38_2058062 [Gigaspora rosea]|uniref:Berberine/berberine-like domain-containing protein n=1 Tax=Gigaspora rosea TaxID=44941 RepID=A0A397W6K1_9GLOM|nr:hypothetical protein C2G38_2058062 [Gigaspora rosea]
MSSDNLVDAEIVLADGTIVENANATKYEDLLWALRGAGNAGYGIVTSLTLQIYEIPKTVTFIDFTYYFNLKSIKLIYQTLNELGQGFDKDLTMIIGFLHPGNMAGDWFSAIYKNARYPMNTEEGAKHPRTVSKSIKIKSFYVNNPGRSDKGVESLFNFMETIKKEEGCGFYIETTLYAGGKVNEIPRSKTAFVHRDSMYDILTDVSLPLTGGEKCLYLLENFAKEFREYIAMKLVKIKLKYDPYEVFRWSQSIPASSSS